MIFTDQNIDIKYLNSDINDSIIQLYESFIFTLHLRLHALRHVDTKQLKGIFNSNTHCFR